MQRYHYCWQMAPPKYQQQADECQRKSRILAKKMKAHAAACPNCSPKDDNFYGID